MKRSKKIALVVAALLIIAGGILAVIGFGLTGNDLKKLNSEELITNTHTIGESFEHIRIRTSSSDIQILPSSGNACTVVCDDSESRYHTVAVEAGTLTITQIVQPQMFSVMLLYDPTVTVYLPERQYKNLYADGASSDILDVSSEFTFENVQLVTSSGDIHYHAAVNHDLTVKTSSGDIDIANCHADGNALVTATSGSIHIDGMRTEEFTVNTSSGDMYLSSITARTVHTSATSGDINISSCEAEQDVTAQTSSGDLTLADIHAGGSLDLSTTSAQITLTNAVATAMTGSTSSGDAFLGNVRVVEQLSLDSTSGMIRFDGSDAGSLLINSSSGDISGTLLTPKFFVTHTTSGEMDVPESDRDGGRCEIRTTSGDIDIQIAAK